MRTRCSVYWERTDCDCTDAAVGANCAQRWSRRTWLDIVVRCWRWHATCGEVQFAFGSLTDKAFWWNSSSNVSGPFGNLRFRLASASTQVNVSLLFSTGTYTTPVLVNLDAADGTGFRIGLVSWSSLVAGSTTAVTQAKFQLIGSPGTARVTDISFEPAIVPTTTTTSTIVHNEKGEKRAIRSDGECSGPTGDTGRSFNFRNPCKTHDLGYDLMRFFDSAGPSGQIRKDVDSLFFLDLKIHCDSRAFLIKPTCASWERTYYQAVASNSARQGYGVP